MSTYTLKSVVRRGTMLGLAVALGLAAVIPAASTFADALNPLTERSLTLSSGSPGWNYTDASGNPTYAPPNSGANGQKTGNTFSFRVSSNSAIDKMTFQYCTTPAGDCMGPGNNALNAGVRESNADAIAAGHKTSDLKIVVDAAQNKELDSTFFGNKFDATTGQPNSTGTNNYDPDTIHPNMPNLNGSDGNFIVLTKTNVGDNWAPSDDWTMGASVKQTVGAADGVVADETSTGQENFITLTRGAATPALSAGSYVKVIFFATNNTYITNPGEKEFFVKINTLLSDSIVDGGVTVANVMNRSIEIQTKVLETMQFSVGTVDPNTLNNSQLTTATLAAAHSPCDPIAQGMNNPNGTGVNQNVLQLGDAVGEFSLRTDTTYSTHSYWRLSSNSSGGATVYYSGVTLSNTVGDQIKAIGKDKQAPTKGAEQFGLALDNGLNGTQYEVSYAKERTPGFLFQNGADNNAAGNTNTTDTANAQAGIDPSTITDLSPGGNLNASWHKPRLYPLTPKTNYSEGTGTVNVAYTDPQDTGTNVYGPSVNTKFAFDPDSNVIPTPIADGNQVLDCVTGKMRYIANIAATTPAGIYTTKINYIAAPKY